MKCCVNSLIKTDGTMAALVGRVTLGLVMLPHGLQKTIGAFGGYGFEGTMGFFTGTLGLSPVIAFLVIMAESVGAAALLVGMFTRFCAASLAIVMIGAASMAHASNGFFMNWFGAQAGEGIEYHLLVIGLALSLVISGGGRFSVDGALAKRGCASR
jgi:putative oxidoreductase